MIKLKHSENRGSLSVTSGDDAGPTGLEPATSGLTERLFHDE